MRGLGQLDSIGGDWCGTAILAVALDRPHGRAPYRTVRGEDARATDQAEPLPIANRVGFQGHSEVSFRLTPDSAGEVGMILVNQALPIFVLLSASVQTDAVGQGVPASTAKADSVFGMIRVGTIVERVEPGQRDIRVYEGSQPLDLPLFTELAVARPADPRVRLDALLGNSVGLVPPEKPMGEWTLYTNVVGVGGEGRLTLADNVFKVRKVIRCSRQHAVELRMDGWVYRVKPGQVVLVLG